MCDAKIKDRFLGAEFHHRKVMVDAKLQLIIVIKTSLPRMPILSHLNQINLQFEDVPNMNMKRAKG